MLPLFIIGALHNILLKVIQLLEVMQLPQRLAMFLIKLQKN